MFPSARHICPTGGVIEPQAFMRLAEMAAEDILEQLHIDRGLVIEGIETVARDQSRQAIPLVVSHIRSLRLRELPPRALGRPPDSYAAKDNDATENKPSE